MFLLCGDVLFKSLNYVLAEMSDIKVLINVEKSCFSYFKELKYQSHMKNYITAFDSKHVIKLLRFCFKNLNGQKDYLQHLITN